MDLSLAVGLGLVLIVAIVFSTTRIAINKGYNGPLWLALSFLILPSLYIYLAPKKADSEKSDEEKSGFNKIVMETTQPFIDIVHTSRALTGVNISYILEGLIYFGFLSYLVIFFNQSLGLNDIEASHLTGVLTAGITIAMLVLGGTVDWIGVRKAILVALFVMLLGRTLIVVSPTLGGPGVWNGAYIFAFLGIIGVVIGYGIYQPAAYAAVKKFTNKETAAMGYAMLYALMNLGGYLPAIIAPPIRKSAGMEGVFWVYIVLNVVGLIAVAVLITKKAEKDAATQARKDDNKEPDEDDPLAGLSTMEKVKFYLKNFPIKDGRFMFFIFILIFVQTLFAHNWLTIPLYTSRAFEGAVKDNFEFFSNLNPFLVFILAPVATAFTIKKDTYKMMIIGTFIMAAPTFILAFGPTTLNLVLYLVIMTVGESLWQPRFLQWVAEIAPKNMTGIYMGIGQFPWFLTKAIVPLYSGYFLMKYIPADVPTSQMDSETMWLIYGAIAMISSVGLIIAKPWMMKGFKTKTD